MIRRMLRLTLFAGTGYVLCFLLLFFSAELSDGIREGIRLCMDLVIPGTFLFLILAQMLLNTSVSFAMARPFFFLARLFKIPTHAVRIFLLSLIGGYPVGAKLLTAEVKRGNLSKRTAARMLCFCTNCSPSFLITGVGTILFHNAAIGFLLFGCETLSCCLIAFLSRFFLKESKPTNSSFQKANLPFSRVFVDSVTSSTVTMAGICAFVVFFSAVLPVLFLFLDQMGIPKPLSGCIGGLLEVSNGCSLLTDQLFRDPLAAAALFTSFGGVCVLFQIALLLKGTQISIKPLLFSRFFHCAISVGLLIVLKPFVITGDLAVFGLSLNEIPKTSASSPIAFFLLILLAVMLLFFTVKPATMKLSRKKRKSAS